MAQKNSSLKILVINISLVFVLLAVSLIAAEWILRLYIPDTDHKGMNELAPAPLYYRIIPNYQGILEGVKININSDGYRDSEFERQRHDNQKLVAIIGDSITFGQGVAQEKTFPAVLENLLNQSGKKTEYRVWNLGVPGYNTQQEFEVFNSFVLPQNPGWIFLAYVINDVEPVNMDALKLISGEKPENPKSWLSTQLERSLTIQVVRNRLGRVIKLFKPDYRFSSYVDDALNQYEGSNSSWSAVSKMIEAMNNMAQKNDIKFTVVMIPSIMDFNNYPFQRINQKMELLCKEKGIDFLDLLPYFKNLDPQKLVVSIIDAHPNSLAHKIIAGALAERVVNGGY